MASKMDHATIFMHAVVESDRLMCKLSGFHDDMFKR